MIRLKIVSGIALAAFLGLGSAREAKAQWGGCHTWPGQRVYSAGFGPGWNGVATTRVYSAGYVGFPGYYRSAGFVGYPGIVATRRVVVPTPVVPVYRPVVVAPGWGPGWNRGFAGPGVGMRIGF